MYTAIAHMPAGNEIIATGSLGDCHRAIRSLTRTMHAINTLNNRSFPQQIMAEIVRDQDQRVVATMGTNYRTMRSQTFDGHCRNMNERFAALTATWRTFRRNMTSRDIAFWVAVDPTWTPR